MLSLMLLAATTALPQAASPIAKPTTAAKPTSLFDMVAGRMSAQGRPIFTRYIQEKLIPQVRADAQAETTYRQQLHTVVAAPTLDMDAAQRLIDQRKSAENASTATIRSGAFAMIKTLPAADRKLALTAIFADARLTAAKPAATTTAPAKSK